MLSHILLLHFLHLYQHMSLGNRNPVDKLLVSLHLRILHLHNRFHHYLSVRCNHHHLNQLHHRRHYQCRHHIRHFHSTRLSPAYNYSQDLLGSQYIRLHHCQFHPYIMVLLQIQNLFVGESIQKTMI